MNTFSGELIKRELDGEDVTELADFYNDFFFRLFNPTIELYRDNYQLFGNPQVMVAKFVYDSLTYFTTLGTAFCHGLMSDRADIDKLGEVFEEVIPLLPTMQRLFRDWNELDQRKWEGVSVLSKEFMPYINAQADMARPGNRDEVIARSKQHVETVKAMALWIFQKAAKHLPEQPDDQRPINLYALSLHPERWDQDGLYAEHGMTIAEAIELLPGVEEMDLEARGAVVAG